MDVLIYFDTEDFFSAPDSPVHQLPGQLAEIMTRHGLPGCFHLHGEKARFMERHGQTEVIEAIKRHDVSLHYDRGSIHPTTAEEVSQLDWCGGVERVLFRELPGFQALERIFGKCSGLTQHGGTFAAQIVYAAGKLGKPFFYSPFRLPGRNLVWYCNNLLIGGYQADFYFDQFYRDTPAFEERLARVDGYLSDRAREYDFTAMFGCHPVITMMQEFPDAMNFRNGATPPPDQWLAPVMVPGVSIPLILENFERLVVKLVGQPKVHWTDVQGLRSLYGLRPVRVSDAVVLKGAEAVVDNAGPTFTKELSAAELLYLLARRALRRADWYETPQVIGPVAAPPETRPEPPGRMSAEALASGIVRACQSTGALPEALADDGHWTSPEAALLSLACHALGRPLPPEGSRRLSLEAIPGVPEALENVRGYKDWRVHGPGYHQPGILAPFLRQCWTLKPAVRDGKYGEGVETGDYLNPMFDRR
ncbi:hypothetical protein LLH03_16825 [bacterium]|nr:hypothetical protein [bacterium]